MIYVDLCGAKDMRHSPVLDGYSQAAVETLCTCSGVGKEIKEADNRCNQV